MLFFLVEVAGASVNLQDNWGYTALMLAVKLGHTRTASVLIGAGAGLDLKDEHGFTALIEAAINGRTELAKALIKWQQ